MVLLLAALGRSLASASAADADEQNTWWQLRAMDTGELVSKYMSEEATAHPPPAGAGLTLMPPMSTPVAGGLLRKAAVGTVTAIRNCDSVPSAPARHLLAP